VTEHLPQTTLLRYVDGELSRKTRKLAARHLESCWQCRAAVEKLQHDIHLIVEAHGPFLRTIPPPPRHWSSLDARLTTASERKRRLPWNWPMLRSLYAGGVLAAAACLVLWMLPGTMTAEQVLHRVAGNDNARMHSPAAQLIRQRVRVTRTETRAARKTVGTMECWSLANRSYWRVSASDGPGQRLRARAADASLAGQLPLAPDAYQTWLRRTGTAPVLKRDAAGSMTLIASAAQHARDQLWQVRLHVDTAAWQVSGMELVYPQESLEITEEQFSLVPQEDVPGDVLASLEVPPAPGVLSVHAPTQNRFAAPATQDLDATELSTLVELHRLKADLGEPIQVARIGGKVVVQAAEVARERQQELARVLANRPGVLLRVSRHATRIQASVTDITQRDEAVGPALRNHANDEELRAFFGGFREQENFTGVLLEREHAVEGHLYALRNLAVRFNAAREVQLSPSARQDLNFLVAEHQNAARQELSRLQILVQPLLQRFAGTAESGHAAAGNAGWQENAARALAATQAADLALRRVLTTTGAPASPAEALPNVQQRLRDAQTVLQ
jgi:hypothetical protein